MTGLERSNIHLLLVEDNPRFLDELIDWLEVFGYQHIETARNVDEAKSKLDEKPFDVIVLDMRLEHDAAGGFAALAEVKKRNITSAVIVLTAHDTVEDSRRAFKDGAWDYLAKSMKGNVFEVLDQSILDAINSFNLRGNDKDEQRPSILELIKRGESETVEFKSTLGWDVRQKRVNKKLRFAILETIVAFMNSAGGHLVIGVADDGAILGLENDLSGKTSKKLKENLENEINARISMAFGLINVRFETIEGKDVCAVDIEQAPGPVFMNGLGGIEFYIRDGHITRALHAEEIYNYIQTQWE